MNRHPAIQVKNLFERKCLYMKKITGIFMLMLTCFAFGGCDNVTNSVPITNTIEKHEMEDNTATGNAVSGKPNTASLEEEESVSYECDRGKISLCLPDGWSHKIDKYKKTKEDESFGITFWQNQSKKKNEISVQYTKFFGVCGTELETKKIKINNMESEAGYYDGKPYWDYIMLDKKFKNTFVVLNFCESENWWKKHENQVMEILDTLTVNVN